MTTNLTQKPKTMKITITIFLATGLSFFKGQTSVNVSGGNASGFNGSVSYSIGQVFQQTAVSSNNYIIEGVQQPYEVTTLGIDNFSTITVEIKAYPNPTTSILFLNFSEFVKNKSKYELFDASGRLMKSEKIQNKVTSIDMQNNASGIYILKVSGENKVLKSFKIIKK